MEEEKERFWPKAVGLVAFVALLVGAILVGIIPAENRKNENKVFIAAMQAVSSGHPTEEQLKVYQRDSNRKEFDGLKKFYEFSEDVIKNRPLTPFKIKWYRDHSAEYGRFMPVQSIVLDKFRDQYGSYYLKLRLLSNLEPELANLSKSRWNEIHKGQQLDMKETEDLIMRFLYEKAG